MMSELLINENPFPGVSVRLYGRKFGNCNINPVPPDLKSDSPKDWCQNTIRRLGRLVVPGRRLVLLKPAFIPCRVLDFKTCQPSRISGRELYRASIPGDAYLLSPGEQALIASADCLSAVISGGGKVFVVHLGGRGLIPLIEHEQPLLGYIIKTYYPHKGDRRGVSVWLGAGADRCCLGYNEGHPILEDLLKRYPGYQLSHQVLCGPRKGQIGLSQMEMAKKQLENLKVGQIQIDSRCTSCWGDPSDKEWGEAYSNLRDDCHNSRRRTYFRNGLVVSFDP